MRKIILSVVGAGLLLVGSVNNGWTTLIEQDFLTPSDTRITLDTDTNLQWLDVNYTQNMSYNDIYVSGGLNELYGWRHATNSELDSLFSTYIGSTDTDVVGIWNEADYNLAASFYEIVEMLGQTKIYSDNPGPATLNYIAVHGIYDDPNSSGGIGSALLDVELYKIASSSTFDGYYRWFTDTINDPSGMHNTDFHRVEWGNWLVREQPAPVPEPATMLLFGTGVAGLAASRIRRKKR